ncbi:uncharacterized protein CCOS01_14554, partial [Colletotrichum costaricense]
TTSGSLTPTAWSPHHPRRTSNHHKRRILRGATASRVPESWCSVPQSLPIVPSTTPVAPRTPSPTTDAPPVSRSHSHRRPPPFPRRLPAADPRAQKGDPSRSIVEMGNLYLPSSVSCYFCRVSVSGTLWITNLSWKPSRAWLPC